MTMLVDAATRFKVQGRSTGGSAQKKAGRFVFRAQGSGAWGYSVVSHFFSYVCDGSCSVPKMNMTFCPD